MPKAVDTNLVARFILRDDPAQASLADSIFRDPLFIPSTVLVEIAWVLDSCSGLQRRDIADALANLLDLPTVHVEEPDLTAWALSRLRAGADLADMLHLVAARNSEAFLTFDRALARHAGKDSPVSVETLRA